MSPGPTFPDEPIGRFPAPPRTVEDGEGREIRLRALDDGVPDRLVEMYVAFDPADRAQGVPPTGEDAVQEWLGGLFEGGAYNVVAKHGERIVGHATLVSDGESAYELAIFVTQGYQGAGIGTELMETLLGYGQDVGVEKVWLTVERWNHPAKHLYEKVGFHESGTEAFEVEMTARLN
jgi:RimJ/RimL family protein N-acetyltransferase